MAIRKLQITAVAAILLLLFFSSTSDAQVSDVTNYGAKADGISGIDRITSPCPEVWSSMVRGRLPGDKMIAIRTRTARLFLWLVHVTGVKCGPGHGIRLGSLGKYQGKELVSGFWVKNCTLTNTQNGVRVKTWPTSYPGSVSDLHFEDINMVNVGNPILIDRVYCPWNQCQSDIPSLVKISIMSFRNIRASSSTVLALKLACSSKVPCKDVVIGDTNLTYKGPEAAAASSQCSNAVPTFSVKQSPQVCA
ncbi:hypothetical protein CRG98_043983 [Punica granatum]|uniref:Exopolygalacturonase-like n=1 Tax=Punica granatum TaxID=22663 RepID=A0A2I0HUZ5_PUNGR|nr:hypothetical protein CRG98_043983 [Punica granatum]